MIRRSLRAVPSPLLLAGGLLVLEMLSPLRPARPGAWTPGPAELHAQQPASRMSVTPARLTLAVGESATLEVLMAGGAAAAVETPTVRLLGPRGAVRLDGLRVTAVEPGEYELVVAPVDAEGLEPVTVPLTVTWPRIERVAVEASGARPYVGTTVPHAARALHADRSERPDAAFEWSSSDPSVATVDAFGYVTAVAPGRVRITATAEGATGEVVHEVVPLPAVELRLQAAPERVRTGDVVHFEAVALDAEGRPVEDLGITWSHAYRPLAFQHQAASAAAQLDEGDFVADLPGLHTVVATAGPLSARHTLRADARDVVRELELVGVGRQPAIRTTDFWVFEGRDGRDYVITGSKVADGHAYVFDVTDPGTIVKTDSIQVDARTINDVKVSPDARYATLTREGASDRRNGVVILDLADPAHPVVASEVTERLTGGVHNAFPTETHAYALSNGDKYVVIDMSDLYAPRVVGEYDHPDSRVHDVWVVDGLAYTAEWGTGLVVTDVGDGRWGGSPENPVLVSTYALPTGGTHAAFPYVSESTGKHYVFVGDEIMSRGGLAWSGYPRSMGSYSQRYDPETGLNGVPLTTQGYVQVIDFSDPEDPEMVARYEVPEYGTHNIWVEDDVLYQAYYEGGMRMVDVSGELMGNLYTQGREIAVFKSVDPAGYTPNATMVWSAMPYKGHVFFTDTNSGLWAVRVQPEGRPIS